MLLPFLLSSSRTEQEKFAARGFFSSLSDCRVRLSLSLSISVDVNEVKVECGLSELLQRKWNGVAVVVCDIGMK